MDRSLIEKEFISYFKSNPKNTYEQFQTYLINNYKNSCANLSKIIDSIRKKLQRNGSMFSERVNGSDGKFMSVKTIVIS
jgi:hypothetical protein